MFEPLHGRATIAGSIPTDTIMELLGSGGSPYVRRIRLLLGARAYDFREMNIYGADREALKTHNPILKIPTLLDDGKTLFESRVIHRYLADKFDLPALTWSEENAISVIDGASDAGVVLRLSEISGLDTTDRDVMYHHIQHERLAECLDWLANQAEAGLFKAWGFASMCLYSAVDWLEARQIHDLSQHEALTAFLARHADQPMVAETDPRQAPAPKAR